MGLSGAGSSWARQPGYVEVGGLHFRRFELPSLRRPAAGSAVSGQPPGSGARSRAGSRRSESRLTGCWAAGPMKNPAHIARLVSAAPRSRFTPRVSRSSSPASARTSKDPPVTLRGAGVSPRRWCPAGRDLGQLPDVPEGAGVALPGSFGPGGRPLPCGPPSGRGGAVSSLVTVNFASMCRTIGVPFVRTIRAV